MPLMAEGEPQARMSFCNLSRLAGDFNSEAPCLSRQLGEEYLTGAWMRSLS
jgi:hypothetical protein